MSLFKRSVTELLGTFWLVLGGCGSAVIAASSPLGIGMLGVALAFGLTVLTMAFAIGHISGCHLNPAVSVGLFVGGRFPARELPAYIIAQVLGGILVQRCFTTSLAAGRVSTLPPVWPPTVMASIRPASIRWLPDLSPSW